MFGYHIGLVLFMFVAPLAFASDMKITERDTPSRRGVPARTTTKYICGRRTRFELRSSNGFQAWNGGPTVFSYGHRTAYIYQCDARRLLILDLDAQEYMSLEIDERGQPVNAPPSTQAKSSFSLETIPSSTYEPSGGTLDVYVEDIDTGERKTVFGYTARHSIRTERHVPGAGAVSPPQEVKRDGWYIDVDFPEGCPSGQFKRPQGVAVGILVAGAAGTPIKHDKIEIHHTGVQDSGFPIELTISSPERSIIHGNRPVRIPASSSKTEVTELSTTPLDPALFELPAGFKQVSMLSDLAPQPPSSALLRVWAWVRQSISAMK